MRKSIKLSALAAAFLINSVPAIETVPTNGRDEISYPVRGYVTGKDYSKKDNKSDESVSNETTVIETVPNESPSIESISNQTVSIEIISDDLLFQEIVPSSELVSNSNDSVSSESISNETISTEPTFVSTDSVSNKTDSVNSSPSSLPSTSHSISLPNNGLIWISEDPNIGELFLNAASLPIATIENGKITEELDFYIRSNYASFIDRLELSIYRAIDKDLVEPLAILDIAPSSFTIVRWDGKLPDKYNYEAGDELIYLLRAYDKEGTFDETSIKKITLQKLEDAKSSKESLKDAVSKGQGVLLDSSNALSQYLLDEAFSKSTLTKHNIVTYGSKVVIRGMNIPDSSSILINNEPYPIDFERKFIADYIVPTGTHNYDITLLGEESITKSLGIEVSPYYMFGTAIADFTLRKSDISEGSSSGMVEDDLFKEGRLAFYLKGKLYGKYHITAQADTTQKDIKSLFSGFTQANPKELFESLDPDMYYPTYGDDSTTFKDVNTQGKFYLKTSWDKSEVLWGNYDTGFEGQYSSYQRSLYGAKLDYRSKDINPYADPKQTAKLFISEALSALGHSEFLGTGGSLYYLKHMDILPGSEKILLQVTDKATGNTQARIELKSGIDYEIDSIQGRVILTRPLSQIIYENINSITTNSPLNGYEQRLIVDYEYVPRGFEDESLTAGIRVKQWLNDYIALGGTYVREEKGSSSSDYEIMGGDITLQMGKGTYLKGEITRTNSNQAPIFYSSNGGLSFSQIGNSNSSSNGNALSIDARVNFKEMNLTDNELTIGSWYRDTDQGFSQTASSQTMGGIKEYGSEITTELTKSISLYTKASQSEKKSDDSSYTEGIIKGSYKAIDKLTISAQADYRQTDTNKETNHGLLGALRADYDITPNLETYLTGQLTIDNNNGAYDNNDALITGVRYLYDGSTISSQYTTGHRGDAVNLELSHKLNTDHTIYGGYTWNSQDYSTDNIFTPQTNQGFTVGQKWNLTNKINLYNESQLIRNGNDKGTSNSLGMDFYPGEGWNMGFLYQKGDLTSNKGDTNRDAISVSIGQTSSITNWLSKFEYRKDTGAEEKEQYLTTNRVSYKLNESLRLAGRFNHSKTTDKSNIQDGARFTEANIGFAYRPLNSNTIALFARYTYLYDISANDRISYESISSSKYDQKSQIVSLEGIYKYNSIWEFALKYANRLGEARYNNQNSNNNQWFDSSTTFYAGQIRYDILYDWHAIVEYRVLDVKDGGTKRGYMLGMDKDINKNFRLGFGYNFTDFSDDLRIIDYRDRGWFVNGVGVW
jgi:hypothetical protein